MSSKISFRNFTEGEMLSKNGDVKVFLVAEDFVTIAHEQFFAAVTYQQFYDYGWELYSPTVNMEVTQTNPIYQLSTTFKRRRVMA